MQEENVNGLALCAGIGGIELGLRLAIKNYRTVCYCEREAFCAATLMARMERTQLDQAPIWSDLASFDGRSWRGAVDIITAGFPCQPFSFAGKKRGFADERWIWPDIVRIIREVEPALIFLENPKGILKALGQILSDLAESGYNAVWEVFSAAECGLPQLRERVFLLAYNPRSRSIPIRILTQGAMQDLVAEEDISWQTIGVCRRATTGRTRLFPFSGFRGMAHGFPEKLDRPERLLQEDRLRCMGNAVVPVTAACAFITLWNRVESLHRQP